MIPALKTPPASPVEGLVTLQAVRDTLSMTPDDTERDALISSLIHGAVAYLDGWHGVLGRAILEQEWTVEIPASGDHLLPLPDVKEAAGPDGPLVLRRDAGGAYVTVTGPCTVDFKCELPVALLPAVRRILCAIVAHWFMQREAVAEGTQLTVPMSAEAMISAIRWGRF